MPSPSAIWVCDRPSCCRMRRKRGPTNSFLPVVPGIAGALDCDNIYKITYNTSTYVTQHHHSSASCLSYFGGFAFSSGHVFATHCHECRLENEMSKSFEALVPAPQGRFDGI